MICYSSRDIYLHLIIDMLKTKLKPQVLGWDRKRAELRDELENPP